MLSDVQTAEIYFFILIEKKNIQYISLFFGIAKLLYLVVLPTKTNLNILNNSIKRINQIYIRKEKYYISKIK